MIESVWLEMRMLLCNSDDLVCTKHEDCIFSIFYIILYICKYCLFYILKEYIFFILFLRAIWFFLMLVRVPNWLNDLKPVLKQKRHVLV